MTKSFIASLHEVILFRMGVLGYDLDAVGESVTDDGLVFHTPSAAAVFVLGGSQNGWTEWVSEDGRTLSAVKREA